MEDLDVFGAKANVKYKDSMFRDLFQIPENAVDLCRALLNDDTLGLGDIQINTLSDVLFDNVKNDVSYDVNDKNIIVMVEHQSTLNYNMPLRMLLYLAREYEKRYRDYKIYKKQRIEISTPLLFVMYNGDDEMPAREILRLSDSFPKNSYKAQIEVIVLVINLNKLDKFRSLKKCKTLEGYSIFTNKVKSFIKAGVKLNKAIENAINYCKDNDILKDYLEDRGSEVVNMFRYEYDREAEMKAIREDGIEAGREEGREEGIRALINTCRELNVKDPVIAEKLMEKFSMDRESALKYLAEM